MDAKSVKPALAPIVDIPLFHSDVNTSGELSTTVYSTTSSGHPEKVGMTGVPNGAAATGHITGSSSQESKNPLLDEASASDCGRHIAFSKSPVPSEKAGSQIAD